MLSIANDEANKCDSNFRLINRPSLILKKPRDEKANQKKLCFSLKGGSKLVKLPSSLEEAIDVIKRKAGKCGQLCQ